MKEIPEKMMAVLDEAHRLAETGRLAEAEERFRRVAETAPIPAARNNWALCRLEQGDPAGALQILKPLLADGSATPFTCSLAAMVQLRLGNQAEAHSLVRAAVDRFDHGLWDPEWRRDPGARSAWVEQTVFIKRTAGWVGDHRLVLELHSRWPGREIPMGAFLAGVAAFNLGRYRQAIRYWRRIQAPGWQNTVTYHTRVAEAVDRGLVPPFPLEYQNRPPRPPDGKDDTAVQAHLCRGSVRLRILAHFLAERKESGEMLLGGLIAHGGAWGVELGRRLLNAAEIPLPLKTAAAQGLIEAGAHPPDEPFEILHEGRPLTIEVQGWETDEDAWREQYEERPLSPQTTLRTALRKVPLQWLNAAAAAFSLSQVRRPEREARLVAAMQEPEQLCAVVGSLPKKAREVLRFVLEQGGWCRLEDLVGRFGPQTGDGLEWDKRPPASAIGAARARGLLFVGTSRKKGRTEKVAVVPSDLRAALAHCLKRA